MTETAIYLDGKLYIFIDDKFIRMVDYGVKT